MAPEIVSTVTSGPKTTGGTGGSSSGANARPVITQSLQVGSLTRSAPTQGGDSEGGGRTIENQVTSGGGKPRMLSEGVREMLSNLDKHGSITAPKDAPATAGDDKKPDGAPAAAPAGGSGSATAAPAGSQAAPAASAPPPATETPPAGAANVELERSLTRNRELAAEVERLKTTGSKRDPTPREKALQAAEQSYFNGQSGAIDAVRAVIAHLLGVDDPKHKDVDAELSGLYQDLTARELGVSVDTAQQATREAARTRQLLAREQRERKAEQESASKPASDDPETKQAAEHAQLIGNHLSSKQADGKTVADSYPGLMKFAPALHGHKPEALVLRVIRDGFATGEFDPKEHDDKLIAKAATKIEASYKTLYQALADVFGAAPATSTAAPNPSSDASAHKERGQQQAARTITSASASVAPATPPAKPETPATPPRKYKTEAERRRAIVEGHTGGR